MPRDGVGLKTKWNTTACSDYWTCKGLTYELDARWHHVSPSPFNADHGCYTIIKIQQVVIANYLDKLQEKTISIQIKSRQHSQWFESNHPHGKNPSYLKKHWPTLYVTYRWWFVPGYVHICSGEVSRPCTISQLLVSVYHLEYKMTPKFQLGSLNSFFQPLFNQHRNHIIIKFELSVL